MRFSRRFRNRLELVNGSVASPNRHFGDASPACDPCPAVKHGTGRVYPVNQLIAYSDAGSACDSRRNSCSVISGGQLKRTGTTLVPAPVDV